MVRKKVLFLGTDTKQSRTKVKGTLKDLRRDYGGTAAQLRVNLGKLLLEKVLRRTYQDVQHDAIMQFVKFGIVGVSNTMISYFLYAGTLLILQMACLLPKTDYLFAQIVAFILSVLWAFYWDNKMVFAASMDTERIWWKALIKTYISYSCTDRH